MRFCNRRALGQSLLAGSLPSGFFESDFRGLARAELLSRRPGGAMGRKGGRFRESRGFSLSDSPTGSLPYDPPTRLIDHQNGGPFGNAVAELCRSRRTVAVGWLIDGRPISWGARMAPFIAFTWKARA